MNAWIGHLLTAVVIGGALAAVYARLTAQLAVMQTEINHLREPRPFDVEEHSKYCERFCPVRRAHDRDEWRESTGVRSMPTDPHGHPTVGGK